MRRGGRTEAVGISQELKVAVLLRRMPAMKTGHAAPPASLCIARSENSGT